MRFDKHPLLLFVILTLAIGTGVILYSATSKKSTELRSKAAGRAYGGGGPYPSVTPTPDTSDTTAPSVTITSPLDGTILPSSGSQNVAVTASDPQSGVRSIQIYLDSTIIKTCTRVNSCTGSFNIDTLSIGSHAIVAKATNGVGLENSVSIVVTKN